MENLNHGESSSNGGIRSRFELLSKPQLVDLLCNLASRHPSIAQEIETLTNVHSHRTLFVSGLSSQTNSQTLSRAFEEYGEIERATVIRDKVTKISKNYGFVTYRDVKSVHDALREPRKYIDGSVARCDVANERQGKTSGPDFPLTRKIYIGDLAAGVTSENLRSDFQMHGEIEEAVAMTNDRYGFVTFATAEAAKKAIDHNSLHPTFAEGRKRIVKYANPRRGPRALRGNSSPEYEQAQAEDDYVDYHSPVPYGPPPYEIYGVSYPRVSAVTDEFGTRYYCDYSYPY
ncbi:unnamed protein product [Lathyrus oleraceus]